MEANGDDIKIMIGAEADSGLNAAQMQVIASFKSMENDLRKIGTDAAGELADSLSAVAEGIKAGSVDTRDVAEYAMLLDKAAKSSELSDEAIDRLNAGMSNLARNSRSVSDAIRDSERQARKNSEAFGKLQEGINAASPAVGKVTGGLGRWFGNIKGVNAALAKTPALLTGILGGVGVIIGAFAAIGKMLNDYQKSLLEIEERNFRRKGEEIAWAKEVAEARIATEQAVAEARLENEQAIADAEHEIASVEYDVSTAKKLAAERSELNRQMIERTASVEKERMAINKRIADLQREQAKLTEEQSKEDERRVEIGKELTEEMMRRDELQKKMERFGAMRSSYAAAKEEAMRIEDPAERQKRLDELRWDFKNRASDLWEGIKNSLGGSAVGLAADFDPEEAEEQYQKVLDEFTQQNRKVDRLLAQATKMDADAEIRKSKIDTIDRQKEAEDRKYAAVGERADAETAKMNAERDERVANKQIELMGAQNRLTAMGLGGGIAGADPAKDTAKNTGEMVKILRSISRNEGRLRVGQADTVMGGSPNLTKGIDWQM